MPLAMLLNSPVVPNSPVVQAVRQIVHAPWSLPALSVGVTDVGADAVVAVYNQLVARIRTHAVLVFGIFFQDLSHVGASVVPELLKKFLMTVVDVLPIIVLRGALPNPHTETGAGRALVDSIKVFLALLFDLLLFELCRNLGLPDLSAIWSWRSAYRLEKDHVVLGCFAFNISV